MYLCDLVVWVVRGRYAQMARCCGLRRCPCASRGQGGRPRCSIVVRHCVAWACQARTWPGVLPSPAPHLSDVLFSGLGRVRPPQAVGKV